MSGKPEPQLDDDFHKHDRLFHYTSPAGLYGILESGCLWATHYRFLNDNKELFRARDTLVAHLERAILPKLAKLKANRDVRFDDQANLRMLSAHEAAAIVDTMYAVALGETERVGIVGTPYIFSTFCCNPREAEDFEKGILLHWATYARSGGYAVQLDPHKVKVLMDSEKARFPRDSYLSRKITYIAQREIPKELEAALSAMTEPAQGLVEAMARGGDVSSVDVSPLLAPFLTAICTTKDTFFRPENEARIVFIRSDDAKNESGKHDVCMRIAPGLAAPYVKLFEGNLFADICPIERILVGPHSDNQRRVIALNAYLRSKKLDHIKVEVSQVPYQTQLG